MERNGNHPEHKETAVFEAIERIIQAAQGLSDAAFCQYSSLVEMVIHGEIQSPDEIERIMDGLLDFCNEERFIMLYKKICRHIYYRYPQLVSEHIHLFKVQFDEAKDQSFDSFSE